jgi:hypothetical protein
MSCSRSWYMCVWVVVGVHRCFLPFFFFFSRLVRSSAAKTPAHTSKLCVVWFFFARLRAAWLSFFFFRTHTHTKSGLLFLYSRSFSFFLSFFFLSVVFSSRACTCPSSFYIICWTLFSNPSIDILTNKKESLLKILWIKVHYRNKLIHCDINYVWKKHHCRKRFKSKFVFIICWR